MKLVGTVFLFLFYSFSVAGQVTQSPDSILLRKRITSLEGRYLSDFPVIFSKVERLVDETMISDCTGCKGRALMLMGEYYWANGQYPEGLIFFRQAIEISRSIKDYSTWSTATDFIAKTYYYQAYYDSAEYYFKEAYAIAEQANDFGGMILILHNTSLMYHRKGDFERTVEYIFKGEKLKDQHPETRHHIEAMGAMGALMIDSIYYTEEINDELRNVHVYKEERDTMSLYYTYKNLGKAYRQLRNFKTAAKYFIKSAETMELLGFMPEWDLVAIDYGEANMPDSCFYYHYLAKHDISRVTQLNASYTLELLGNAHLKFGRPDSSLFYYDSAFRMSYRMNNRITYTGIHRNLVKTHTLLGNYKEAEYHLSAGLALAKEVALIHEKNLYREGQALHEAMGNYKRALFYSEKYKNYMDSLNRQETAINLTYLQAEFKMTKRKSELKELMQINLLGEEKIKTRNSQIVFSIVVILLIGSLGGMYYSRYRKKERMSEVLQRQKHIIEHQYGVVRKQNTDKEALLHEIHHRVKNNLQIISSLINIKSRMANVETKGILKELSGRIHSLGLIHEMLYKSDHLGAVNLTEYLTQQSKLTLSSLQSNNEIELVMELDQVETNLDSALAFGLISNELITNAIKYAFTTTQQAKQICVTLKRNLEHLHFCISDNGTTIQNIEIQKSFGLRFVDQLVKSKFKGEVNIKQDQGLRIEMKLLPHG